MNLRRNLGNVTLASRWQKRFEIFVWYQARCFDRSIKYQWRETESNRECLVSACQAPETQLFSNFRLDGMSYVFMAKLVIFCWYAKCFPVVMQQHEILKSARAAAFFQRFQLNMSVLEFSLLKIRDCRHSWKFMKCVAVTKATCFMLMTCLWLWCLKKIYNLQT